MLEIYFSGVWICWLISFVTSCSAEDDYQIPKFWFRISLVWPAYLLSIGTKEIIKVFK